MAPLVRAWIERPRKPARRHLIATAEKYPPKDRDPLILTRETGLLALSRGALDAVAIDGAAFVTRTLGGVSAKVRRWRKPEPPQGELFGAPKTLDGRATAGAIVEAVAFLKLDGDGRSPLRADLIRLGTVAYALTGAIALTDAEGAILIGGRASKANRERFNRALWALRYMRVEGRPGIWWALADAEPGDDRNRIGPAQWMLQPGGSVAWRLTGGLFRPATKWGVTERVIGGIEAALAWGPSPGRGKRGRAPDNLQPVRKGGPGPKVFIPWWQVLRLAGENVGPESSADATLRQRWKRLVGTLRAAGYMTPRNGPAPAGDTIEVVEVRRGARNRPAGIVVRASARYCAAAGGAGERVRVPATRLIQPHE